MKFYSMATLFLLSSTLYADDNINLDYLLGEFSQKSDLSKKTKLSNAGHSIVFTRDDIERMQARNLKDILKSLPLITYQENRFGIPNIRNIGDIIPFSSSSVRVYLDDHEMVSGTYGSGFALMGNVELEFVDHIEVYYNTASFEYSVESTALLIKLYTKVPQRDKGGKVLLSGGTHGSNQESAFYSDTVNDISYFAYLSNLDNNRDNVLVNNKQISKNATRKHFLGTISNKDNHLLIDSQFNDIDPLSHITSDGTATKSLIGNDNLQISYINTYFDNIKLKATYQQSYSDIDFRDDFPLLNNPTLYSYRTKYKDSAYSSEINYGLKSSSNSLFLGSSVRAKGVDVTDIEKNGISAPISQEYDKQSVYSTFIQDEFFLTDNSVISAGTKYSKIENNGGMEDQELTLYRLGYVYNKNNFTGKLFYYHTPSLIEPYLYTSWFSSNKKLKPEVSDIIYTQIEYDIDKNYISLIYGQNRQRDTLYFNPAYSLSGGSLDNSKNIQDTNFINLDYKYSFNSINSIATNYFINFIEDSPLLGDYREYGGYIRFLNTINRFDIFNEITYRENSLEKQAWFDYSAGIKYKYSDNLFLSLKGENLFDRAYKEKIRAFNIAKTIVGESTPIDKRIFASVEYMF